MDLGDDDRVLALPELGPAIDDHLRNIAEGVRVARDIERLLKTLLGPGVLELHQITR